MCGDMPRFIPNIMVVTCHECLEEIPLDALVMWVPIRDSYFARTVVTRKPHCEECGKLYLESQQR